MNLSLTDKTFLTVYIYVKLIDKYNVCSQIAKVSSYQVRWQILGVTITARTVVDSL